MILYCTRQTLWPLFKYLIIQTSCFKCHIQKWLSSLIYAGGQFVMFLLVYTFFNINTLMGNTYILWMYVASCIVSIMFVCCCVPETRALNLNRIQSMLDNRCRRDDKYLQRIEVNKWRYKTEDIILIFQYLLLLLLFTLSKSNTFCKKLIFLLL